MTLILILAALVVVLVFPVMMAARIVGAGKSGFGPAFVAVLLQACLSIAMTQMGADGLISALVAIAIGSAIYAFVLDTSFWRGLVISLLAVIISVVVIALLASSFAVMGSSA